MFLSYMMYKTTALNQSNPLSGFGKQSKLQSRMDPRLRSLMDQFVRYLNFIFSNRGGIPAKHTLHSSYASYDYEETKSETNQSKENHRHSIPDSPSIVIPYFTRERISIEVQFPLSQPLRVTMQETNQSK